MNKALVGLLLALPAFAVGTACGAVELEDFANAAQLQLNTQAPIYRLSVPEIVYAGVTRSDLGDLRVFNGEGAVVPHALRLPPAATQVRDEQFPLPLFPLHDTRRDTNSYRLSLRLGSRFESIEIYEGGVNREQITGYLLDAREIDPHLQRLVFEWAAPQSENGMLFRVDIEAGDDLEHWRRVAKNVALAELFYLGRQFRQNGVRISAGKYAFYRLTFQKPHAAPRLLSVHGIRAVETRRFTRVWRDVQVKPGEAPGEYLFANITGMRLYGAEIALPETNTLVSAALWSRPMGGKHWRRQRSAQLYRLSVGDGEVSSEALSLDGTLDEEWKLSVEQSGGGIGAGLPVIRLSWQPHELVFVARGEQPFRLAWGSRGVGPVKFGAASPFDHTGKSTLGAATLAAQVEHPGGTRALAKPVDWRRWILWGTLVAGALLIVVLAVRLYGRMNKGTPAR